jgi:hypothetical protein
MTKPDGKKIVHKGVNSIPELWIFVLKEAFAT